jgi:hypothetical protein
MARQIQFRRGTTAQHSSFTGAVGEVTVDTDKDVVVVHDGSTAGGFPMLKAADLTAGTGISIAGTTIANTAPDQTVSLTASTGISVSGTYPSFTVTNTAPDQTVALTAGTSITISGTYPNFTITNAAPDQTVALTAGSNVTITGSYPNFTIAATDTNTTYTAGTGLQLVGTEFSVDSTVVTTSGTQTLTGKTLTDPAIVGTILEDVYTISDGAAFEIDPGNGSVQLITLGASRTPKATNFAAGEAVTLLVDDGSAYTLTWTDATFGGSGVVWKTDGGVAPTLNTTGYTVIVLFKVASQVYGARVGDA